MQLSLLALATLAATALAAPLGRRGNAPPPPTIPDVAGTNPLLVSRNNAAMGLHSGGDITWYKTGLGSCGKTNAETDFIVALPKVIMDQHTPGGPSGNPNKNTLCGKKVDVKLGGKHVQVTVTDTCPECTADSIDLSPAAFKVLAPQTAGRLQGGTWEIVG